MGCLKIAPIFIGCGGRRNGREGLLYNEGWGGGGEGGGRP